MFCPATKFRLDVSGRVVPDGHTMTHPEAVGFTAVTFRTTADTPLAGTPPLPNTCNEIDPKAGSGPLAPRLILESRIRAGVNDARAPGTTGHPPTTYTA